MAERDLSSVISHLTRLFNVAIRPLDRAARNPRDGTVNAAYIMESEFAHVLNELMQGPPCVAQRHIAACNDLIDQAMQYVAQLEQQK